MWLLGAANLCDKMRMLLLVRGLRLTYVRVNRANSLIAFYFRANDALYAIVH